MRRLFCVLVAVLAITASLAASAGADPANDKYYDASVLNPSVPTDDPCVTADVRLGIQKYLDGEPTVIGWSVAFFDACAGGYRAIIGSLADPVYIPDSDFVVDHADGTADLHTTLVGYEELTHVSEDLTFDLHWTSDSALSNQNTSVTGSVTSPSGNVLLGPGLQWNRWGTDLPWANLSLCMIHDQHVGPKGDVGWGPGCTGIPFG